MVAGGGCSFTHYKIGKKKTYKRIVSGDPVCQIATPGWGNSITPDATWNDARFAEDRLLGVIASREPT